MPSERIQRRIDSLLDQVDEAVEADEWARVETLCRSVLRLDPENRDALAYLQASERDAGSLRAAGVDRPTPPAPTMESVSSDMNNGARSSLSAAARVYDPQAEHVRGAIDVLRRARKRILVSRQEQGTVTILVSKTEASTEFNVGLRGDHRMELLEHDRLVRGTIAKYPGREVGAAGDALMVIFQVARDALRCAIDVQRAVALRNAAAERPMSVRVGLHTGEVAPDDSEGNAGFHGTQLAMASRIASQAADREVLVSSRLRELVASTGEFILDARSPVARRPRGPRR